MLCNQPACWWPTWEASNFRYSCKRLRHHLPKPVANPFVPFEASTSTQNDPRTLMPQLVRDARYCSYPDMGVEIFESINQWPPATLW